MSKNTIKSSLYILLTDIFVISPILFSLPANSASLNKYTALSKSYSPSSLCDVAACYDVIENSGNIDIGLSGEEFHPFHLSSQTISGGIFNKFYGSNINLESDQLTLYAGAMIYNSSYPSDTFLYNRPTNDGKYTANFVINNLSTVFDRSSIYNIATTGNESTADFTINSNNIFLNKGTINNSASGNNSVATFTINSPLLTINSGLINNNALGSGSSAILKIINSDATLSNSTKINNGSIFNIVNSNIANPDKSSYIMNDSGATMNIIGSDVGVKIYGNGDVNFGDNSGTINTSNLNTSLGADDVNNKFANSVNLKSGTTLNLNSNINSVLTNVNDGATLNIGSANRLISGNFAMNSGGTLALNIDSQTSSGKLNIIGSALISDNVKLEITLADFKYVTKNNQYTILTVENFNAGEATEFENSGGVLATTKINKISDNNISVNGKNNQATNSSNESGILIFTTYTDLFNLYLNVEVKTASQISSDSALQSIYDVIINDIGSSASGSLADFQNYLTTNISNKEIESALQSISPQNNNVLQINTLNAVNNSTNVTTGRLAALRNYDNYKNDKNVASARAGVAAGENSSSRGIWGQFFGNNTKQNKVKSDQGYKSNSDGFAFGIDREFFDNGTIGLNFSYADTNIKTTSGGSKRTGVDSYQFNIYGSNNFDNYFLDTSLGIACNKYKSSRFISGINQISSAEFTGQTYIAKAEVGSHQILENSGFDITPKLTLTLARSYIDGYTEEGAGTSSLTVSDSHSDFAEGKVGFNLGYNTKIKNTKTRPEISASYGYDFAGSKPITTSHFVGQSGSSFTNHNSHIDKSSLKIGTGLEVYGTEQLKISVKYEYEHRKTRSSNSGLFDVRYDF